MRKLNRARGLPNMTLFPFVCLLHACINPKTSGNVTADDNVIVNDFENSAERNKTN